MSFTQTNTQGAYQPSNGTVLSEAEAQAMLAQASDTALTAVDGESNPDSLEARLKAVLSEDSQQSDDTSSVEGVTETQKTEDSESFLRLKVDPVEAEELEKLNELLKKRYGLDAVDFEARAKSMQAAEESQAVKQLQSEWGVDDTSFNSRLDQIRDFFKTLPEDMQAALDNPIGAKLIWANLEKSQAPASTKTPAMEKSSGAKAKSSNSRFLFTQSEILSMSPQTYNANQAAVYEAYAKGLVDTSR